MNEFFGGLLFGFVLTFLAIWSVAGISTEYAREACEQASGKPYCDLVWTPLDEEPKE